MHHRICLLTNLFWGSAYGIVKKKKKLLAMVVFCLLCQLMLLIYLWQFQGICIHIHIYAQMRRLASAILEGRYFSYKLLAGSSVACAVDMRPWSWFYVIVCQLNRLMAIIQEIIFGETLHACFQLIHVPFFSNQKWKKLRR